MTFRSSFCSKTSQFLNFNCIYISWFQLYVVIFPICLWIKVDCEWRKIKRIKVPNESKKEFPENLIQTDKIFTAYTWPTTLAAVCLNCLLINLKKPKHQNCCRGNWTKVSHGQEMTLLRVPWDSAGDLCVSTFSLLGLMFAG